MKPELWIDMCRGRDGQTAELTDPENLAALGPFFCRHLAMTIENALLFIVFALGTSNTSSLV